MDTILWILGLIGFLLVISISVGLHEASHMFFGKLFKLEVPRFFIGFGKTLWSFKTSKTEYGIKLFPLGGFVNINDPKLTDKEDPDRELLTKVHPIKRIIIFSAGAISNLIFGFILLVALLLTYPSPSITNNIQDIKRCSLDQNICGAQLAGILPGDIITNIDNNSIEYFEDISPYIDNKKEVTVTVLRNEELFTYDIKTTEGQIGVNLSIEEKDLTLVEAFGKTNTVLYQNIESLLKLPQQIPETIKIIFGAERTPESISSIVSIGKAYGDISSTDSIEGSEKLRTLWMYSGLINIGLGFINLMPLMPLDGGRIFISFIDLIKLYGSKILRKKYTPVGHNFIESLTAVTGSLVLGFMALLIVADIMSPVSVLG